MVPAAKIWENFAIVSHVSGAHPVVKSKEISTFLEHLKEGSVCAHPTDTIPGLSCDPRNESAVQSLERCKKRTQIKSFVGLVASFESASHYWEPLPKFWRDLIKKVWPGPITFVWKARANVPSCLVSNRGELALRYPRLKKDAAWFVEVMQQVDHPMPSTSINYEEQKPITGGKELVEFCQNNAIYLPTIESYPGTALPSSVLRILDGEDYEWLRIGAFSEKEFLKAYHEQK